MRILLATSQFAPELGGVPRLLWDFCSHRPATVDLRVVTVQQQDAEFYADFDARAAFPIMRVPPVRTPGLTSLRVVKELWQTTRVWPPDVILSGVAYPTAIMVAAVARWTGTPFAVYAYSEDLTVSGRARRALLSWALTRADAAIALAGFAQQEMLKLGVDPQKITVSPPGVTLQPPSSTGAISDLRPPASGFRLPASDLQSDSTRWGLLTVGRLVWRKGQDSVIRALPHLVEHIPNIHYVVAGSGPDESGLRALAAEMGVAERVTFAGRMSEDDLLQAYRDCDVFVLPTRPSEDGREVEGFGIVFLEAGAAGKPVIAGRAGGVEAAVLDGETGLLVDPTDGAALAAAIGRFHDDPALARRLGAAGRARVEREFSVEAFATRVTRVLESVCRRRVL